MMTKIENDIKAVAKWDTIPLGSAIITLRDIAFQECEETAFTEIEGAALRTLSNVRPEALKLYDLNNAYENNLLIKKTVNQMLNNRLYMAAFGLYRLFESHNEDELLSKKKYIEEKADRALIFYIELTTLSNSDYHFGLEAELSLTDDMIDRLNAMIKTERYSRLKRVKKCDWLEKAGA